MFLSFVIDAFGRRIVRWQFAGRMRTDLVADALRMAFTRREPGADVELVHHSDAGSQYTSYAFQRVLDDHAVLASIGSVGDAYDNALAESFVDTFKTELISDRVWRTRTQLELAIVEWSTGSTTTASTNRSVTSRPQRSKPYTRPSTLHLPLSINEERNLQTRSPSKSARLTTDAV